MLMPYLFECTLENQAMLAIPQHFLSNPMASKAFAEILLNFLMDRIKYTFFKLYLFINLFLC
jgi:hypothetical protein